MKKPFKYGEFVTWSEDFALTIDSLIDAVKISLHQDIPGLILINADEGYGSSILANFVSIKLTGRNPLLCGKQYERTAVEEILFGKDSILRKAQNSQALVVLDEIDSYSEDIIFRLCSVIDNTGFTPDGNKKRIRFTGTILGINKSKKGINIPARVKPFQITNMVERPLDAYNLPEWFLKVFSTDRVFPPRLDSSARDLLIRYAFGNNPKKLAGITRALASNLEQKIYSEEVLVKDFPDLESAKLGTFVPVELAVCNDFLSMGLPKAQVYRLTQFKLTGGKRPERDNLSKWVLRRQKIIKEYAHKVPFLSDYLAGLKSDRKPKSL